MPRLSHSDRSNLLRYIGQKQSSQLSDREILQRAAQVRPSEEKDFEQSQTHHTIYHIPPVSPQTAEQLYKEIAQDQEPEAVGWINVNYENSDTWVSTRLRLAEDADDTVSDYEYDILGTYEITNVIAYEFKFRTEI